MNEDPNHVGEPTEYFIEKIEGMVNENDLFKKVLNKYLKLLQKYIRLQYAFWTLKNSRISLDLVSLPKKISRYLD